MSNVTADICYNNIVLSDKDKEVLLNNSIHSILIWILVYRQIIMVNVCCSSFFKIRYSCLCSQLAVCLRHLCVCVLCFSFYFKSVNFSINFNRLNFCFLVLHGIVCNLIQLILAQRNSNLIFVKIAQKVGIGGQPFLSIVCILQSW